MQNLDAKGLAVFLVIGIVAGFLASLVVGGGGLIYYLIIGVIGAFVGGIRRRGQLALAGRL